jgi:hypothetical protein
MNKSVKLFFAVITGIIIAFMIFGDAINTNILGISFESKKVDLNIPDNYSLLPAATINEITVVPKGWRNAVTIKGEISIPQEVKEISEWDTFLILNNEQNSYAYTIKYINDKEFLACIPSEKITDGNYSCSIYLKNRKDQEKIFMLKLSTGFEVNCRKKYIGPYYNNIANITLPDSVSTDISGFIDFAGKTQKFSQDVISIEGWAFKNGFDSSKQKVYIHVKSQKNTYIFETRSYDRYGLSTVFTNAAENLDISTGFICDIPSNTIEEGTYLISIIIENENNLFYTPSETLLTIE